jgi:hypothetical protein
VPLLGFKYLRLVESDWNATSLPRAFTETQLLLPSPRLPRFDLEHTTTSLGLARAFFCESGVKPSVSITETRIRETIFGVLLVIMTYILLRQAGMRLYYAHLTGI